LKRYPSKVDLGCLLAFRESDRELLWQHSSEKLASGRVHDWPLQGICCAPLVEGDRLWFVTSRGEVRCLDTKGFYDDEDDGAVQDELATVLVVSATGEDANLYAEVITGLEAGKLASSIEEMLAAAGEEIEGTVEVRPLEGKSAWKLSGSFAGVDRELTIEDSGESLVVQKTLGIHDKKDADVVWIVDMMGPELGISQHNMCSCSVTSYGDLLFVNTSNGLDESDNLPKPDAPSFICIDKTNGDVLWTDKSPGLNILHGQWSSPAVGEFEGGPQVIFTGGDGIVYSFKASRGKDGAGELLWKFDCNPKTTVWRMGGEGTRNNIVATPVVYNGLVYIAVGQDPDNGEGQGHLWCIDPTGTGDVSPTLAVKTEGGKQVPIEHRREQAVIEEDGEEEIKNPNSKAVWHYSTFDTNGNGEIDFEEEMHRTIGSCAIKDDVLYIADISGILHCLDARGDGKGGAKVHFHYDMLAQSWGTPLIANGHVYIGDEDGDVAIFEFGPENVEPIDEINMGGSVYSSPIAANDTLFISTKDKLFAIAEEN
ncbi:MAG: PQQ-binding-like beta-propeller repeat protein, partial [Planctomycetota bacterium]